MSSMNENIKFYRIKKGLTQKELAEQVKGYKLSNVRVAQYESGKRTPKFETLKAIANALDVSINELLGSNEPHITDDNDMDENNKWYEGIEEQYMEILHMVEDKKYSVMELVRLKQFLMNEFKSYTDMREVELDSLANVIGKIINRGPIENIEKIKEILKN